MRLGERLPLGYRQTRALDDLLLVQDGSSTATTTTTTPGCGMDMMMASHFAMNGLEEVEPGSLEQLMYDGMR